jgi:hypothetical protein
MGTDKKKPYWHLVRMWMVLAPFPPAPRPAAILVLVVMMSRRRMMMMMAAVMVGHGVGGGSGGGSLLISCRHRPAHLRRAYPHPTANAFHNGGRDEFVVAAAARQGGGGGRTVLRKQNFGSRFLSGSTFQLVAALSAKPLAIKILTSTVSQACSCINTVMPLSIN